METVDNLPEGTAGRWGALVLHLVPQMDCLGPWSREVLDPEARFEKERGVEAVEGVEDIDGLGLLLQPEPADAVRQKVRAPDAPWHVAHRLGKPESLSGAEQELAAAPDRSGWTEFRLRLGHEHPGQRAVGGVLQKGIVDVPLILPAEDVVRVGDRAQAVHVAIGIDPHALGEHPIAIPVHAKGNAPGRAVHEQVAAGHDPGGIEELEPLGPVGRRGVAMQHHPVPMAQKGLHAGGVDWP